MSSPNRAARLPRKRLTRSTPTTGRIAAWTRPPPSLVSTTSGASAATKASTSPPSPAARKRSATLGGVGLSAGVRRARDGDVAARPVQRLPARGLAASDGLGDLPVRVVEHVVEHEHGALQRSQPLEQQQEPHRQRLAALDAFVRAVAGGDRLGQPHARVALSLEARRAEHVQGPPCRGRDEPGLGDAHTVPVRRRPPLGDVADDVLGLDDAAEHAVGDGHQLRPCRLEGGTAVVVLVHAVIAGAVMAVSMIADAAA